MERTFAYLNIHVDYIHPHRLIYSSSFLTRESWVDHCFHKYLPLDFPIRYYAPPVLRVHLFEGFDHCIYPSFLWSALSSLRIWLFLEGVILKPERTIYFSQYFPFERRCMVHFLRPNFLNHECMIFR